MIIKTFNENIHQTNDNYWFKDSGEQLDLASIEKSSISKQSASDGEKIAESDKAKADDLSTILPDKKQENPKRLVISFASENLRDVEDLEKNLAYLESNGKIQIQYDKLAISGRNTWDDDIRDIFSSADGYIILVSKDYQFVKEKTYIWQHEIPIIEKRFKENNIFTYCISVSPVHLNNQLSVFASFKGGEECLPESGHARDQYLVDFAEQVIEKKFLNKN